MCKDLYGHLIRSDLCAYIYTQQFPHDLFDNFDHPVKPWVPIHDLRRWLNDNYLNQFNAELFYGGPLLKGYKVNIDTQILFTIALKLASASIGLIGVLLFIQNLLLPSTLVIALCLALNLCLHYPSIHKIQQRTGSDSTAYLNQAG